MQKLICFLLFISLYACSVTPPVTTEESDFDAPNMKYNSYSQDKLDELKSFVEENKENIKKLNQDDVINLLGTPFLEKQSGSKTIVWQYRGICTLNIIWIKVNQANTNQSDNLDTSLDYKISWIEALDISKNTFDSQACFSLILKN